jgi:DNA repair exonuclease SbcCD nuclease subunit
MKILLSADWHIALHKKKIPSDWQANRFRLFYKKLYELEQDCDIHIIAGDVFDKKPEPDEICLFLSYINSTSIPTFIIPGNHEATKKGYTFLSHFHEDNAIKNSNVEIITQNTRKDILSQGFQFFPYGEMQTNNLPKPMPNDILVTHIRGEVPPHITPEYDFEKLRPWKLILLGDLHFNHRYLDYLAYYPGSPLNVSFDRDEKRQYGVDIINFNTINDYSVDFIDLKLPKLLHRTIKADESKQKDDYHHVIYEITGSIDELSKISNHDQLDKKIAFKPEESSKLELKDLSLMEELKAYLEYIKVDDTNAVITEFQELNIQ